MAVCVRQRLLVLTPGHAIIPRDRARSIAEHSRLQEWHFGPVQINASFTQPSVRPTGRRQFFQIHASTGSRYSVLCSYSCY